MEEDAWRVVMPLEQLPDGRPVRVEADGEAVLLVREGERLLAIGNRCSHQGAPLNKGPVRLGSLSHVTCPAHGSMFNLADGTVLRGPATDALPAYDARVNDGIVEIRRRT